jgi:hypothetical protein
MDTSYNFYRFSIHSSLPALLIPRDCNVYFTHWNQGFVYSRNIQILVETHTLACPIFKISQFSFYKLSNIIYISFIFNILHIYNYQGERTRNPLRGLHLVHMTRSCRLLQFIRNIILQKNKYVIWQEEFEDKKK